MDILRTYIQQTSLSGTTYDKGDVVDILATYGIATEDFPFVYLPETKELPTRDWNDDDGEEIYVPAERKVSAYDMTVKFLYNGGKDDFRNDIDDFIGFLYGRNTGAKGSRLAIYDEHVKDGRKDVTVKSVSTDLFFWMDEDDNVVAEFSVVFRVSDPSTKVIFDKENNTFTW